MLIYLLSAVFILLILLNYILAIVLYKEPKNSAYFHNVTEYHLPKSKHLTAQPRYVVKISILIGIAVGLYMAFAGLYEIHWLFVSVMVLIFLLLYLMELTKSITLEDGILTYSSFPTAKKKVEVEDICGMYIYSFNKKFLKQHAYTTKLVISLKNGEKIIFPLSSLDNRSVLNMMKDNFGVTSNKMYIANKKVKD